MNSDSATWEQAIAIREYRKPFKDGMLAYKVYGKGAKEMYPEKPNYTAEDLIDFRAGVRMSMFREGIDDAINDKPNFKTHVELYCYTTDYARGYVAAVTILKGDV